MLEPLQPSGRRAMTDRAKELIWEGKSAHKRSPCAYGPTLPQRKHDPMQHLSCLAHDLAVELEQTLGYVETVENINDRLRYSDCCEDIRNENIKLVQELELAQGRVKRELAINAKLRSEPVNAALREDNERLRKRVQELESEAVECISCSSCDGEMHHGSRCDGASDE